MIFTSEIVLVSVSTTNAETLGITVFKPQTARTLSFSSESATVGVV